MEGKQNLFQVLKSSWEMEENKFWYMKDNCYNDLRNMVQMDSMNLKGKEKGKEHYIILLTKALWWNQV